MVCNVFVEVTAKQKPPVLIHRCSSEEQRRVQKFKELEKEIDKAWKRVGAGGKEMK